MTSRRRYLAAVIRLYLQLPGAPHAASPLDWAVAQSLFSRGVSLPTLAHAMRLATLRRVQRDGRPLPPVRCLAFYRCVLEHLTDDELDPRYLRYVAERFQTLAYLDSESVQSDRQKRALPDRR